MLLVPLRFLDLPKIMLHVSNFYYQQDRSKHPGYFEAVSYELLNKHRSYGRQRTRENLRTRCTSGSAMFLFAKRGDYETSPLYAGARMSAQNCRFQLEIGKCYRGDELNSRDSERETCPLCSAEAKSRT